MICDYNRLLGSAGGDRALVNELIGIFRADCPNQLEDIKVAINGNNPKLLYEAAHKLKGSLDHIGAYASLDQVIALETMAINGKLLYATAAFERLVQCVDELILTLASIDKVSTE